MNLYTNVFQSRAAKCYLGFMVTLVLCAGLWSVLATPIWAQGQTQAKQGTYSYTVLDGDSWETVAKRTGLTVEQLKAANPGAVRDSGWLLTGEQLVVPVSVSAQSQTQTHVVKSGESWTSIADKYGVSTSLLQAANPRSIRAGMILYAGEVLVIPPKGAVALPTAVPTPQATATPTATNSSIRPTITVTIPNPVAVTETVGVTGTGAVTTTGMITATGITTSTAAAGTTGCPAKFSDYPERMVELINSEPDGIKALNALLVQCKALVDNGFVVKDFTGDGKDDLVVVYQNPTQQTSFVEGDLIIFDSSPKGYELGYRARAAGQVRLLATEDVNDDRLPDVVWVDTTCGASTCFDTVNIRSWDGSAWTDRTDGTITMAYADIKLSDVSKEGQGREIVLSGGIYGSVGAGPQRSRTEVWASIGGAPYTLAEKTYSPSECLYHTVLDANRAFLDGPTKGFKQAEDLYTKATTDKNLIKCWVRENELDELRSFSQFRLALIAGYEGKADIAASRIAELTKTYPGSTYEKVGQVWLKSYQTSSDAATACGDVTKYAQSNPAAWEILADYGYTNPSFEAADVCPTLRMISAGSTAPISSTVIISAATPISSTSTVTPTAPGDNKSGASPTPAPVGQAGKTPVDASASLPACPANLAGYAGVLPKRSAATSDQTSIENWMSGCGVMDKDRGAVVLSDLNADGVKDAIFYPTLITDKGFGPKGARRSVLIYHSQPDGSYKLVAAPEIYGQPSPLAVGDLNSDGRMDVAWTVVGCSTFCVTEVQMWTWDHDAYVSLIEPGATIANGKASFVPVRNRRPRPG